MLKKLILPFVILLSIVTVAFTMDSQTAAAEEVVDLEEVVNPEEIEVDSEEVVNPEEIEVDSEEVTPYFVNDFRYRKVNVKTFNEWSGYKRASDNITTGKGGGSITATKSVTFGTDVSGAIDGLGISTSKSITSSIGYTLNADPNKTVYMGYRVYYKVETGTREYYDLVTGKVLKSNSYTVKVPQYGEFKLINAK
ncbi:hypothetical protein VO178_04170 [Lysinibacillus fusiformis]|uniref:hypothetical protein n=1 Tax=Lysinibacillus fusiformis TaxID=28031 RepID=UPI0006911574|nr:hypothetical protein [Lysinibacillus fusiformis]WEA39551.1 hypothetical protein PWJ66_01055 [Lysinibacillus fusiformis]WRS98897.1 hypothetical protein VO178_04170 [Lysinibacillus fusiformis]